MGSAISTEDLIQRFKNPSLNEVEKRAVLDELFEIYDKDKTGFIESFETNKLLIDLVEYILENNVSKECNEIEVVRLKGRIMAKIIDILDINSDGKITKEEFFKKFDTCLNIKIRPRTPNF